VTAALTIIAVLSFSVLVIRIGGVALQQTGLPVDVARFQALSVFTGCGFTTTESESIVNYPVRRKIALGLMVIGNIGLVGMLSTIVVSFVGADGDSTTVIKQMIWLAGGVAVILVCLFNKRIDDAMCRMIGAGLQRYTPIGDLGYTRVLQMKDGWSISHHTITPESLKTIQTTNWIDSFEFRFLGIESEEGMRHTVPDEPEGYVLGDRLVLFGSEEAHNRFAKAFARGERDV